MRINALFDPALLVKKRNKIIIIFSSVIAVVLTISLVLLFTSRKDMYIPQAVIVSILNSIGACFDVYLLVYIWLPLNKKIEFFSEAEKKEGALETVRGEIENISEKVLTFNKMECYEITIHTVKDGERRIFLLSEMFQKDMRFGDDFEFVLLNSQVLSFSRIEEKKI